MSKILTVSGLFLLMLWVATGCSDDPAEEPSMSTTSSTAAGGHGPVGPCEPGTYAIPGGDCCPAGTMPNPAILSGYLPASATRASFCT